MTQTPMQELLQWLGEKELSPLADEIRRVYLEKEKRFARRIKWVWFHIGVVVTGIIILAIICL